MTLETTRDIDRGEGWFGKPWVGAVMYFAVLTPGLAAFCAWHARAVQRRSIDRPHALASPADRIAAAHPA